MIDTAVGLCHERSGHPYAGAGCWTSSDPHEQEFAKRICNTGNSGYPCPLKESCLAKGLRGDEFGVWGGTTREERGGKRWRTR